jgi:predicted permease|tara:strand:- start:5653 stop:6534 length:882 start_codon:yes stop_codon:yes gene_type:complete
MYFQIFIVLFPVILCAFLGALWARSGQRYDSDFVSRLVLNIGAPALILSTLSQVAIDPSLFADIAIACVLVSLTMALLGFVIPRLLGDDVRTYLPSFVFPNVGNMGLPVCMFAFGEQGLALALIFFMVLSVAHFPVGILMAGGREAGGLMGIIKMPILYAIALAVLLMMSGAVLPGFLNNAVSLIGAMTIPLMLITLGVSLYSLKVSGWGKALLYSLIRILGGLSAGLLVVWWLDIEGVARSVVLIQSSMPVAVFNYLFAVRFDRQPDAVAGLVVVSTLLSFVSLPILLSWLI